MTPIPAEIDTGIPMDRKRSPLQPGRPEGGALRPVSLTVGHESYPLLDESDEIEYQHVVLAALAATADEFQVTFCAPIPNINRNDAWCFRFAPNRPPVQVSIPASPVASRGRPQ
jgi:hypothetical protein